MWFTDESWFTGDGIAQKKNAYYWELTHDAVKPVRFQKHPTKVHVWAAISVSGRCLCRMGRHHIRRYRRGNIFDIIGKHFDKPWPPYSPDLTPPDIYMWPTLKSDMYSGPNPYKSVAQLKRAITFTFKKFRAKKFEFIPEQVVKRWRLCVHHKGDRWVKT